MRDIDERTRIRVMAYKPMSCGNTNVSINNYLGAPKEASVFLHGNFIYSYNTDGEEVFTLHGWNTQTTRRRLNALLLHGTVCQKNYKPYIVIGNDMHEISEYKYYKHTVKDGWSVSENPINEFEPLNW